MAAKKKSKEDTQVEQLTAEIINLKAKILALFNLASVSQQNDLKLLQLYSQQAQSNMLKTTWPKLGSLGKREEYN